MRRRLRFPPLPDPEFGADEGARILSENPAGLGVLLWDLARDVVLWATIPWADVDGVFAPVTERLRLTQALTAPSNPGLEFGLEQLVRMIATPRTPNREVVALACANVARWADRYGAVVTAYTFMHAAACAQPGAAEWSYHAGRLARRRADYARTEEWLTRAVLLGRRSGAWQTYGDAFATLGNSYVQRGNYPKARKYHGKCLRAARRHRLRHLEGDALHNLCVVEGEVGRVDEMNAYARAAHHAFHEGDPRLPFLANDVACTWMELGLFTPALRVFEQTWFRLRPEDVAIGLGNVCRAAAGAGERDCYERGWAEAWTRIETAAAHENVAQALLDLACGASTLGEWDRAEMAARRSLEIAIERREARIRITAESVLESVARARMAETRAAEPVNPGGYEEASTLAAEFVESLVLCAGSGA